MVVGQRQVVHTTTAVTASAARASLTAFRMVEFSRSALAFHHRLPAAAVVGLPATATATIASHTTTTLAATTTVLPLLP